MDILEPLVPKSNPPKKLSGIYPHYRTEKLADPILVKSIVFYHGATKINEYFSKETVIPINIDEIENSIQIIKNTVKEDKINNELLDKNKTDLINKYNFPIFCEKLISNINNGNYEI